MRRPNILQIVVDDMGYGDLSSMNGGASSTPVLDQLAGDGLTLSEHYSASPVCAPARAALLTGRYPHRTGVIDTMEALGGDRLSLDETTLADVLCSAGYTTGLVGKWHNGAFDPAYHPNRRGFAEFAGFRGGWQDYWDWRLERNGVPMRSDGRYLTDVLTEEAIRFVRRHRSEPFYLHLAYNAPHFPFQAPRERIEPFLGRGLTRAVATIYAMLRVVDDGIARIVTELEALGLGEDTIVMFTSDNGPQLDGVGEASTLRPNVGLNGAKMDVLEGGIRTPAILRWPAGLPARRERNGLVHFTDWFPTLAAAADVPVGSDRLDGIDILPILRGERDVVPTTRFWQWTRYAPVARCNAAMRDGDWKLVWPAWPGSLDAADGDLLLDREVKRRDPLDVGVMSAARPRPPSPTNQRPRLYDLATDPGERHDLSGHEPARVTSMTAALDAWFDEVERDRTHNLVRPAN